MVKVQEIINWHKVIVCVCVCVFWVIFLNREKKDIEIKNKQTNNNNNTKTTEVWDVHGRVHFSALDRGYENNKITIVIV